MSLLVLFDSEILMD